MRRLIYIAAGVLTMSCGSPGTGQNKHVVVVTVSAGAADRVNTPVVFAPPETWKMPAGDERLVDEDGREVATQRGPDGRIWFVIDRLPSDSSRSYRLVPGRGTVQDRAVVAVSNGAANFSVRGRRLLTYHYEETDLPRADVDSIYRRGGYIHPVYTPSGVLVTDDYPPNHVHHHGIWAAWTKTRYKGRAPDFWNMGDGTGKVEPIGLDTAWSGPVHAGFRARHRYLDLSGDEPENVLLETWEGRVYDVTGSPDRPEGTGDLRPYRVFDLKVSQVTAGDSTLHLPEYRYGGVGFRGHRQWNGTDGAVFLTSEGRDRSDGHATRARWCHVGGKVDGKWAGIAILGHPDNFRAPQPMRIHPDEPFFNFAPSQAGDWSIESGERYEARYRYVVYDGEPNPALLDRLWNDYAHPPVVTVETE